MCHLKKKKKNQSLPYICGLRDGKKRLVKGKRIKFGVV